jgi:hypothetical protein
MIAMPDLGAMVVTGTTWGLPSRVPGVIVIADQVGSSRMSRGLGPEDLIRVLALSFSSGASPGYASRGHDRAHQSSSSAARRPAVSGEIDSR